MGDLFPPHPVRRLLALALAAALLAGCAAPAEPAAPPPGAGTAAPAPGTPEALAAARGASGPFALHLTPDLALTVEPSAQGVVTLSTPVNGPETPGYPAWAGQLPGGVDLTSAGVRVTLYLGTSSASVRANQVPVFADLPAMFLRLAVGNKTLAAEADGPATMHAGHVYEVVATLAGDTGRVEPGAEVSLATEVIYSHVATAAEFRFLMGPDHPARLDFA